jgi:hypothetical protein
MTYDPVTVIERPKTGLFKGLPSAGPGTVLVVDREGSQLRVLAGAEDRLTAGEVRWGQIRTLFEVDVTEHPLQFSGVFPCSDDIGGFRAEVTLHCAVTDPAAVVRRGIRDAARVLFPPLTETLRRVCGSFPAEAYQQAEVAGLTAIRELEGGQRHDPAFRVSQAHLVLTLDTAAAAFVRDRKEATRNLARQQDAARADMEKAQLQAVLERSAEQFDRERLRMQLERDQLAAQVADQQQELEIARAANRALAEQQNTGSLELKQLEFERERQRITAELEEQRITAEHRRAELQAQLDMQVLQDRLRRQQIQVTQLTAMLGGGQVAALAMQVVEDPAAIGRVSSYLASQRDADVNRQMEALKLLLESDSLEGWQITEQAKEVLSHLLDAWSGSASKGIGAAGSATAIEPGTGDAPPPALPEADSGVFPGDLEAPQ